MRNSTIDNCSVYKDDNYKFTAQTTEIGNDGLRSCSEWVAGYIAGRISGGTVSNCKLDSS
jgi:hypothetical protein